MRSGHNRAVDWWSLGALMYDMLTGAVSQGFSEDFPLVKQFGVTSFLPTAAVHWRKPQKDHRQNPQV